MGSKPKQCENNRFKDEDRDARWLAAMAPETTGEMLERIVVSASPDLMERIVEHKNFPETLLITLSAHPVSRVRAAVGENPRTDEAILMQLCRDSDPDVRFQLAENHNIPVPVLNVLAKDENPYVAERAKKTLKRLQSPTHQAVTAAEQNQKRELQQQSGTVKNVPDKKLKILVIEDNPADVRLLQKLLAEWPFELLFANRLSTGLEYFTNTAIDLVLLDLSLPDAHGIDTFYQLHCHVPDIPIVVLTGLEDESVGSAAVQAGAQDYLVKGQVLPGLLGRSIKYAVERHQTDHKMKQLNLSLERRIIQLAAANHELDKLGSALALSCEQAIQASNFKSQFVARISHDIRTPVSAVLAITDLLLQEDTRTDHKTSKRLIELIKVTAQSQLRLLNEVLDFSKVEAGKVDLENAEFSPVALVEDVAELFAVSAAKNGVSLMTYIDTELEPVLEGDSTRLREILVNLTSNALKCTPKGEVVIRAIKEFDDERHVTVRFSVIDNGIGLTDDAYKHLFEPFVKSNLANRFGGTGLGLSICKRLVDLMGGRIGAESQEGKGSTFWFSVRLKRNPPNLDGNFTPINRPVDYQQAKVRVLVVDHNSTAREITSQYLKAADWCRHGTAASAEEALDNLHQGAERNEPYAVAIIDLESCSLDGFALAAIIQGDPALSATRLIFLTGVDHRQKGEQAWSAGFSAYLTKPIKKSTLFDCIAEVASGPDRLAYAEYVESATFVAISSLPDGKSKRVLVADDSATTRQMLAKQLEKLGVRVEFAKNGVEAVEAVAQNNYDLVLMDCQMPELDGLEATRAIREMQSAARRTPIIAITGGQDKQSCLRAGMDDFLCKPVSTDQLSSLLARWVLTSSKSE